MSPRRPSQTVRSRASPCYPPPNLQPVRVQTLDASPRNPLVATNAMVGNWAVSFGMPSKPPETWRRDVEETRRRLPAEKRLSVSVVASPEDGWTMEQVANDYAQCAAWAVESGADLVELNFSCPNVASCDGQLFQHPEAAASVAACVRAATGESPLLVKLGHVQAQQKTEVS